MESNDRAAVYQQAVDEAIKLFNELSPESSWNLEADKNGIKVFTRTDAATGLKMARGDGRINRPIEQVLPAVEEAATVLKWDDSIESNTRVEEIGEYTVSRSIDKKKTFVTQRETVLASKTIKGDDGSYLVIGRSVESPKVPETDTYVRAFIFVWAMKLIPVEGDANKCDALYMMFLDPKGKVPTTIFNAFVKEQAQNVHKLKTFCEKQ